MEPISNVDRLVLVLRQRLRERSKAGRTDRPGRKLSGDTSAAAERDVVHALAAVEDLDDRQLQRVLVQNVLSESFGARLINEAKFQQVVDRVTESLLRDPSLSKLLSRAVLDLRHSAR